METAAGTPRFIWVISPCLRRKEPRSAPFVMALANGPSQVLQRATAKNATEPANVVVRFVVVAEKLKQPWAQHPTNETGARPRRPSLLTGLLFDENVCSSGDDLGTGSKRPPYRLHAKHTAADATPGEALGEGIDLIIMAPGKSQ